MQRTTSQSIDQKIQEWIFTHKGVSFSLFFGVLFIILGFTETSAPVVILMQTVLLVILFVGMMIFVYNFGYVVIILTVDEGLNDEERILLKWMIRRAVIISVLWFFGVLGSLLFIPHEPFLLASANCFLLTIVFFFIRKGENPLTEGTSI